MLHFGQVDIPLESPASAKGASNIPHQDFWDVSRLIQLRVLGIDPHRGVNHESSTIVCPLRNS
jgi:hypothetical protein